MKRETKVAWEKSHPFTEVALDRIRTGKNLRFSEIVTAVNDGDRQKIFDLQVKDPLKKENFVIFQYGIILRRPDGRVALFERAKFEQGQSRITPGFSMILSNSNPDSPFSAIPRIINATLCVNTNSYIRGFSPLGLAVNQLSPANGYERPTYCFALYEHIMPDEVALHGRFSESPDVLVDWYEPHELPEKLKKSGAVDRVLGQQYAAGELQHLDQGNPGVILSPTSQVEDDVSKESDFDVVPYQKGHNVFISHSARDTFAAFALYKFLIEQSRREILPTLDVVNLPDGAKLEKLQHQIEKCDGIILVVTPSLLRDAFKRRYSMRKDWVRWEVELAQKLGKPMLAFKLGTLRVPYYFPSNIVANNNAEYADWLNEVKQLIDNVQRIFG